MAAQGARRSGRAGRVVPGLAACIAACAALLAIGGCEGTSPLVAPSAEEGGSETILRDTANGDDWPAYGRTYGEQHYSPLNAINTQSIDGLGLAWSLDLPQGNTVTQPIAVDGVIYVATGLSVVRAIDAETGRELWSHDPGTGLKAGMNLRLGWGVRGLAWRDGRLFVGTQDGRLIALDAETGGEVWSVQTFDKDNAAFISGAPRVMGDKVLIGWGSSNGVNRGYVTAYSATDGKRLWRFYTVPGNPAGDADQGSDPEAMDMAAGTWSGEWWKYGGGGAVWNAMAYDPVAGMIYFGTGSPYPWDYELRSGGEGDNLFIDSIVALDIETGKYRWHYQTVPGDTWDFDATMDIELATLTIGGRPRKVLMQAPKNGYLYVIDRITGEFLSAGNYVDVTWNKGIDPKTGRPIDNPEARYGEAQGGTSTNVRPTPLAAHTWLPMSYSRQTGLVYIPAIEWSVNWTAAPDDWAPATDRNQDAGGSLMGGPLIGEEAPRGFLLAWDPVRQREVWRISYPTFLNGGTMATGGGLVFQGSIDGTFKAFDARSGEVRWSMDVGAPMMAPPITYRVKGVQYVTVLTGLGMSYPNNAAALMGPALFQKYAVDPLSQARRVLTFRLGGTAQLPEAVAAPPPPEDPRFRPDERLIGKGAMAYARHCATCHGSLAVAGGHAPDLRRSGALQDADLFSQIVRGGALEARGMPKFGELRDADLAALRQYLRAQAAALRGAMAAPEEDAAGAMAVH